MKNSGAKRAKLLFLVVKCTRSCRRQAPKRPRPRHTCVQNVTRVEWFSLHGRVRFCGWYDELRSYLTENLSSTRFKEVSNDYSSILFLKKNYETRGDKNPRKRLWSAMFSHRVTMQVFQTSIIITLSGAFCSNNGKFGGLKCSQSKVLEPLHCLLPYLTVLMREIFFRVFSSFFFSVSIFSMPCKVKKSNTVYVLGHKYILSLSQS